MCDNIYIGKTQQKLRKNYGHFSNLVCLLKNGQKTDSFPAHFEQNFNATSSRTDLRKYMTFKVVKHLNMIDAMKKITKPYRPLCMDERLMILKKLRTKHDKVMNKNSHIYGAFRNKTNFPYFFLSTDYHVFNR